MFGWRGRLGVILPSGNRVLEPELFPHLPDGVSLHATRVRLKGTGSQEFTAHLDADVPRAADELWHTRVDAVAFCCQTSCVLSGADWEERIAADLSQGPGKPFFSVGQAMVKAIQHVRVSSIALFSPFRDPLAALLPEYFARHGIRVAVNVNQSRELHNEDLVPHAEDSFRRWREIPSEGAGALCILATDQPSLGLIDLLERDRGQPVLSSNQVVLWALLRAAGVHDALPALGELFRLPGRPAPAPAEA